MEQLVILLLIALISIINWVIQKSKEAREKRKLQKRADATGEPVAKQESTPEPTGTETAMRRLREALGLPEDAPPPAIPKRVEPAEVAPKRVERKRLWPPAPAPLPAPDQVIPPPLPHPERRPVVVQAPPVRRWEQHRRFEFSHKGAKPLLPEAPKESLRVRELLQSQGGLRDAVVLSEILGAPKSLRERPLP
jgi:hypothetical protein